jgi:hypothetical protein
MCLAAENDSLFETLSAKCSALIFAGEFVVDFKGFVQSVSHA